MNKNIRKIITIALTIGIISAVSAISKVDIMAFKVYAASNNNELYKLNGLRVETKNGSGIKLYYDDSYNNYNKVDYDEVESGHIYYALTSSNTVKLDVSGPDSKYVRVFNGMDDSAKGEDANQSITLLPGKNTITVKVYKEEPDKYVEYEDNAKVENTYTVNIEYNLNGKGDDDDNGIYLKNLIVDENNIKLSNSQGDYAYNVANNIDSVTIKAKPEKDDYGVTINGDDVDENDNFEKRVSLDNGENDIKIELEDEDNNYKEYTLKVNKGNSTINSESVNNSNTVDKNSNVDDTKVSGNTDVIVTQKNSEAIQVKPNQWVQVNGKWQYNDSYGNPIKSTWFFDKNLMNWYYMDLNGFMAQNCWILSGDKYYYLNSNGIMATNTTIDGYKVGADGAWIS